MFYVRRWTGVEARALRVALRYTVRDFAARLGVNARTVSYWEANGVKTRPGPEMQAALDTVLSGADEDSRPRFLSVLEADYGQNEEVNSTNRREFLAGAASTSGLAVLAGLPSADRPQSGLDDEQLLLIATASYRRLEGRMPSDELIGPVRAHLGLGTTVAAGKTGTAQLRARMVVSEVAGLTAWLYADLDDRANARRHYQRAVTEAEQSGHELLAIYMRASMGQFAVTSGDPAAGVSLIRQAKRGLSSSAPQVAAIWLDTLEASALAELRDSAALRLLGSVERRLERAEPEAAWPWLFRFDLGKVARYRAVAAARLGEAVQSERAFMECWPLLTAPKQRALMQIERADTLIALGQTDLAVSHAVEAFDAARAYGSHRALHAVAALRRKLPARPPVAVAELDGRLRSMYESAR